MFGAARSLHEWKLMGVRAWRALESLDVLGRLEIQKIDSQLRVTLTFLGFVDLSSLEYWDNHHDETFDLEGHDAKPRKTTQETHLQSRVDHSKWGLTSCGWECSARSGRIEMMLPYYWCQGTKGVRKKNHYEIRYSQVILQTIAMPFW